MKIAIQSSSHRCPKEIRVLAFVLSLLCSGNVVVYLDVVVSPVATLTVGPLLMCCRVCTVVLVIGTKWCVAAESKMFGLLVYTASVVANRFILFVSTVAPIFQV